MRLLSFRVVQLRIVSQRVRSYAKLPASTLTFIDSEPSSTQAEESIGRKAAYTPTPTSIKSPHLKRPAGTEALPRDTGWAYDAWRQAREVVGRVEAEGAEPNLTTYTHLLSILWPAARDNAGRFTTRKYSRERLQLAVSLLEKMITRLEKRDAIPMEEESDGLFFVNAMQLAVRAHNMPMVQRLEALYASPKNRVRLTPFLDEAVFYSHYLFFHIRFLASMEQLHNVYARVVPARAMPTRKLTQALLEKFHTTAHYYWPFVRQLVEDNLACTGRWDERQTSQYRRLLHNTLDSSNLTAPEMEHFRSVMDRLLKLSLSFAVTIDRKDHHQPRSMPISGALEYALLLFKCGLTGRAWGLLSSLLPERTLSPNSSFSIDNNLGGERDDQWKRMLLDFFDVAIRTSEMMNAITCLNLIKHYFPAEIAVTEVSLLVEKIESIMDEAMSAEEKAKLCDMN